MTKREIKELTTSELILALVMNDRQACIEVNSRRGLSKKTSTSTNCLLAECKERGLIEDKEAQKILS